MTVKTKAKLCTNYGGFTTTAGDFNSDGYLDFINAHGHYNPEYNKAHLKKVE